MPMPPPPTNFCKHELAKLLAFAQAGAASSGGGPMPAGPGVGLRDEMTVTWPSTTPGKGGREPERSAST